jgi:hypothetical protein
MSYLFKEEFLNYEQLPSCFLQRFLVCLALATHVPPREWRKRIGSSEWKRERISMGSR